MKKTINIILLIAAPLFGRQVFGQQVFGQQAPTAREDTDAMRSRIDEIKTRAKAQVKALTSDQIRRSVDEQVRELTSEIERVDIDAVQDQVRAAMKQVEKLDIDRINMELAQAMPKLTPVAPVAPMPPMPPMRMVWDGNSYESGKSRINAHNYDKAVEAFDKVINAREPSSHVEGAYYWKAYALNKLGKRDEALASLAELQKKYPQSGWSNDAKALQAEVQAAKGQPVSPEGEADEDLKLYAINALMGSDADRAVPLLEGLLNNPKMSPRLKERALFVLAQSGSDKAHDIVARYAKGATNPDLQMTAVEYLGSFRSKDSRQLLSEVYASSHDVNVKRAVLRSFERSRDADHLLAAAKSEQNTELREEAIRGLGIIRDDQATAGLVALYGPETDRNIKREIIHSLGNAGAAKQLIECARKESDPELKRAAVQRLAQMKSKEALDYIAELLK